jgi:hypothetical protein
MKTQPTVKTLMFCVALSIASIAESDVATDWNTAALNAIRVERTTPPEASRALAIQRNENKRQQLHASIYDAFNGIARTHEPYFVKEKGPLTASQEAAASAAANKVLAILFPASGEAFEKLHEATLAKIRQGPYKRRGLKWGETVADQILFWRAKDNSDKVVEPPKGAGPGVWEPTPPPEEPAQRAPYLLPQWGFVTPFAIPSGDFFRPAGPPSLTSLEYAREYNEVMLLGEKDESIRSPEQTEIALFWADGAGTATPPGHWNIIAQDVAVARRNTLQRNARLFALLNVAMADAAIGRMGCQIPLQLLASGHRDPRGRH